MYRDVLVSAVGIICIILLPGMFLSYQTIGNLDFGLETGPSIIGECENWLNISNPSFQPNKITTSVYYILSSWAHGYVCIFKSYGYNIWVDIQATCGYGLWAHRQSKCDGITGYNYFVTMEGRGERKGKKVLLKLESSFTLPWYIIQQLWE